MFGFIGDCVQNKIYFSKPALRPLQRATATIENQSYHLLEKNERMRTVMLLTNKYGIISPTCNYLGIRRSTAQLNP